MPASIFAGSKVKALKSTLNLNGGADVISSTTDPTSVAVDASAGSLLLNTSSGKLYRKNDSGSSTNWTEVGSGGFGINYITNPSADANATGWNTYADAAGAQPVDGTGGSPNITFARTTTTPLRGAGSFLFTKDAANRQGQGASIDFTIDRADATGGIGPAVQQISFDYEITSAANTYGYGTSTTNSDLTIYIYDVTNAQIIQPAGYKIDGGRVRATFQPNKTSTSYRLCLHIATTSATAWTMELDNFAVGPQVRSYGPAMSDWQSYTPSNTQGFGSITSADLKWRRVGSNVEIRGSFTTGTVTASEAQLSLPSGLTAFSDTNNNKICGTYARGASSSNHGGFIIHQNGSSNLLFGPNTGFSNTASIARNPDTGTNVAGNAEVLTLECSIPITGWSSNTLVSDSADTRVVAARYTSSSTALTGSDAIVNFPTRDYDTHGAVTTGAGAWKFTAPVPGYYSVTGWFETSSAAFLANQRLSVNLFKNGLVVQELSQYRFQSSVTQITYAQWSADIYLNAGEYIDVRANSSQNVTISSASTDSWIAVRRISGPSQIAASEVVAARYTCSSAASLNTTPAIINFANSSIDTHGGVTTGVSWKFTAPAPGIYRVTVRFLTAAGTTAMRLGYALFKNGSAYSDLCNGNQETTSSGRIVGSGTDIIQLVSGDYIDIRGFTSTGTNALSGDASFNFVCVERIGGVM